MQGVGIKAVVGFMAVALFVVAVNVLLSSREPQQDAATAAVRDGDGESWTGIQLLDTAQVVFQPDDLMIDFRASNEVLEPGEISVWYPYTLGRGWGELEDWGIWALGERSELTFSLAGAGPRELVLDCLPYPGLLRDGGAQSMEVWLNDAPLATLELERGPSTHVVDVPESALARGGNRLEFRHARHAVPSRDREDGEARELAVGFRRLALLSDAADAESTDWGVACRVDRDQGLVVVRRSGRLTLVVPAGVEYSAVTFKYRFRHPSRADRCSIRHGAVTSGGLEVRGEAVLERGSRAEATMATSRLRALAAGVPTFVSADVHLGRADAALVIRELLLVDDGQSTGPTS